MKHRLNSLRFRILLPVIILVLIVVTLLTTLYSQSYINMVQQREQEVNAVGFATISNVIVPLIDESIAGVRRVMADDRVASYARLQYASTAELVRARIRCRDYLQAEIMSRDGIYGLLFMRKDGSQFGALPEGNLFQDRPEENPLPEDMKAKILNAPLGETVWAGPVSGSVFYGFESSDTPQSIMIAAWKTVSVSYGECYALMLMDASFFEDLFDVLKDGKSSWYLFTEDQDEICHIGQDMGMDPERLISESNSGLIFRDDNGLPAFAFSTAMDAPAWTLVRKVSMESYEKTIRGVIRSIVIFGGLLLLITLAVYELWMNRFLRQFYSLLEGIVRMGKGDLESTEFVPTSVDEFQTMQREIDRTRIALIDQMDTIRQMEHERMELENQRKEQKRIERELRMAREIQASALPHTFPAYPDRHEFDLFASMTPAKEVGGDFYDFFLIDEDHLAVAIADVSDKGVPAALFMMSAKNLIDYRSRMGGGPSQILCDVNKQLCSNAKSEMFVTVWLGILDLRTGTMTCANAGHEYPMIRAGDGVFRRLTDRHGLPLGVMPEVSYQDYVIRMRPGDAVFVYTDGVPEANNAENELYTMARMELALNQIEGRDPESVLEGVQEDVDAFVQGAEQFDDLAMLCVTYHGGRDQAEDA